MLGIDPDLGHLRFWVASGAAALLVLVCALALDWTRKRIIARFAVVGLGAAFGAILAWIFLAGASVRDQSAERRNLELRATQLTALGLAPDSPLACLDGMVGENVETACKKTLFAAPATVAAATSYIAARLNLLADVVAYTKSSGGSLDAILLPLRRSLEEDRFGFVAHVLEVRDGCSSNRCPALALLRQPEQVRANLTAHTLDRYVEHYLTAWAQPPEAPVADAAPPTGALAASQPAGPNPKKIIVDADFPSAASIPPISIMNPEPKTSPAASAAADANGRGTASARKAFHKPGANVPTQAAASPGDTMAAPADPVWLPGTAPIGPSQPGSPPQPGAAGAAPPAQ